MREVLLSPALAPGRAASGCKCHDRTAMRNFHSLRKLCIGKILLCCYVNLDLIVKVAEEMQRAFHPFCRVPAGGNGQRAGLRTHAIGG
jgi:hypothetical protein